MEIGRRCDTATLSGSDEGKSERLLEAGAGISVRLPMPIGKRAEPVVSRCREGIPAAPPRPHLQGKCFSSSTARPACPAKDTRRTARPLLRIHVCLEASGMSTVGCSE